MTHGLTPKQQRFVEEYLVDLNATQAATRAGYSAKTARQQGQRLLTNVVIADAVREAQADLSERTEVTQDYVLATIVETVERCKQAKPVLDRKGEPVIVETPDGEGPAYVFDPGAVLKGAELIGKHLGMFVDRKEVGKPGEFSELSDTERSQELARLLEAGRAAKAGQTTH